jgi:sialate O-acetylesterase
MEKIVTTFKLNLRIFAAFLLFSFINTFNSYAIVKLPKLVGDNMVLQRNVSLNIWGWADKGEKVSVKILEQELTTVADKDGKWFVKLLPIKEGGPYEMVVTGKNVIKLSNILIGDVWLCSGQSNMEMALKAIYSDEARYEIENANYPMIHFLNIEKNPSYTPSEDVTTTGWTECKPQTIRNFTAVGYFFGRELYKKYQIPLGLIEAAYGGSSAEQWTSTEGLKEFPEFDTDLKKYILSDKQETEAKKKYDTELKLWLSEVEKNDLAFRKGELWYDNNFDTNDWKKMLLPGLWTDNVMPGFDGIVWFRKELEITKQQSGKDLTLYLAQIIDKDRTWFNGVEVGALNSFKISRKYVVPGNLVKEGKNIITIRMISNNWAGGIWGVNDDIYALTDNQNISLAGEWLFKCSESTANLPKQPEVSYEVETYPSTLYNSAIHPIQKFAIKGASGTRAKRMPARQNSIVNYFRQ